MSVRSKWSPFSSLRALAPAGFLQARRGRGGKNSSTIFLLLSAGAHAWGDPNRGFPSKLIPKWLETMLNEYIRCIIGTPAIVVRPCDSTWWGWPSRPFWECDLLLDGTGSRQERSIWRHGRQIQTYVGTERHGRLRFIDRPDLDVGWGDGLTYCCLSWRVEVLVKVERVEKTLVSKCRAKASTNGSRFSLKSFVGPTSWTA